MNALKSYRKEKIFPFLHKFNKFLHTIEKGSVVSNVMGGVYCPTCEAGVEVTATFCLSCGHDLTRQGPITATGHDVNQLKDVIRLRDDLSMAEKFDMIAQIETGADPIALGIAAPAEDAGEVADAQGAELPQVPTQLAQHRWGDKAAKAAIEHALTGKVAELMAAGMFENDAAEFKKAMEAGMQAGAHLLNISHQTIQISNPEVMKSVPIMSPPSKSFCPKCGSDIRANALLQWKKWSETTQHLLGLQLEAAMSVALMHLSATYRDEIQSLRDQLEDSKSVKGSADSTVDIDALKKELEAEIRKELNKGGGSTTTPNTDEATNDTKAISSKSSSNSTPDSKPSNPKAADATDDASTNSKVEPSKATSVKPEKVDKPKASSMFGAKKSKKTYDGEPGGKADWFLEQALDTVYDPHGTGKPIKGGQILARSAEGNVRVRDVIRVYATEGKDGISELAWTSPLTKYLLEAYDAC